MSAIAFSLPTVFCRQPTFCCRLFGVNQRIVPKLDLRLDLLPQPFVASRDDGLVQSNARIALNFLGLSPGHRGYVIICDETCYHPCLDIVSGLRDEYGYVGGYYHHTKEKDKSFLMRGEVDDFKDEDLARLCQTYVMTRCDTNSHVWGIDCLPRPLKTLGLKSNSAWNTLIEMGRLVENCCASNLDQPPVTIAYDAGTSHSFINKALLGLMSPESLVSVPFFGKCTRKRLELPCFGFGVLVYKGVPVLGNLDAAHTFKRFAYHLATSSRVVFVGDHGVELAVLLKAGLPARAYAASDIQSDSDYAKKLNPGYLSGWGGFKIFEDGCEEFE